MVVDPTPEPKEDTGSQTSNSEPSSSTNFNQNEPNEFSGTPFGQEDDSEAKIRSCIVIPNSKLDVQGLQGGGTPFFCGAASTLQDEATTRRDSNEYSESMASFPLESGTMSIQDFQSLKPKASTNQISGDPGTDPYRIGNYNPASELQEDLSSSESGKGSFISQGTILPTSRLQASLSDPETESHLSRSDSFRNDKYHILEMLDLNEICITTNSSAEPPEK